VAVGVKGVWEGVGVAALRVASAMASAVLSTSSLEIVGVPVVSWDRPQAIKPSARRATRPRREAVNITSSSSCVLESEASR
jgi:hypothetical protein